MSVSIARAEYRWRAALLWGVLAAVAASNVIQAQAAEARRDCQRPVAWRQHLQAALDANVTQCLVSKERGALDKAGPGNRTPRYVYPPAQLECVAAIYSYLWTRSYTGGEKLFTPDPTRPMLTFNVIGEDGASSSRESFEEYKHLWVNRQSPHQDPNIHVCDGAEVWLEVARRPRLIVGDHRIETDRASKSEFEFDILGSAVDATVIGSSFEHQHPKPGTLLEPWQRLLFGPKELDDGCTQEMMVSMPTLIGLTADQVNERLQGFRREPLTNSTTQQGAAHDADWPASKVVSQSPEPGVPVIPACTSVTVVYESKACDGPKQFLESVVGRPIDDAVSRLTALGFRDIDTVRSDESQSEPLVVSGQSPRGRQNVNVGCRIALFANSTTPLPPPESPIDPALAGVIGAVLVYWVMRRQFLAAAAQSTPPVPPKSNIGPDIRIHIDRG